MAAPGKTRGALGEMKKHSMIIVAAVLFSAGILMAGSDGAWFPWFNLLGVAVFGASAIFSISTEGGQHGTLIDIGDSDRRRNDRGRGDLVRLSRNFPAGIHCQMDGLTDERLGFFKGVIFALLICLPFWVIVAVLIF